MILVGSAALSSSLLVGTAAHAANPDACSLITSAQAATALGLPAVKQKAVTAKWCQWFDSTKQNPFQSSKTLDVNILSPTAYGAFSKMTSSALHQVEAVSGIGDSAVLSSSKLGSVLNVKKGNNYFSVSVSGLPVTQANATAQNLAKQILPKF
jgi:hypothetical protein